MKKKKYLPLYYKWMSDGQRLPDYGLCWCFGYWDDDSGPWKARDGYDDFALFIPTEKCSEDYWADDGGSNYFESRVRYFNPLRQNIVLLLAAMNQELDEEPRSGGMKKKNEKT